MLAFLYILLSVLVSIWFFTLIFKAISQTETTKHVALKKKLIVFTIFTIWQVYTFLLATSGFIESFELPPRFALCLIAPLFIFTFIFLYHQRNQQWISKIRTENLILIQSFRILVEILFVLSVSEGVLHSEVTIEGYNFDMVFGFTAIIVWLTYRMEIISLKFILFWNYLGLVVLASVIFVFFTTIYTPELYGYEITPAPIAFTHYPFILVAGFLMPLAVFIHVLSIVKYRQEK